MFSLQRPEHYWWQFVPDWRQFGRYKMTNAKQFEWKWYER